MENNDFLANKLINLSFVAFEAEQKHKTLTNNLPEVLFQVSNMLLNKVAQTVDQILGRSLSNEDKKLVGSTLKECALLGLCVFDTRVQFSKQLSDYDMKNINMFELQYSKTNNPSAEEIVRIVTNAMEKGKKVDPIEKTPPYVIKALTTLTAKVLLGFKDAKITDKLTEKENELLFSSLNYLISNVYFCGIIYVYLATKPANNSFQSFIKKTLNIK